jgi:hypothetical protein
MRARGDVIDAMLRDTRRNISPHTRTSLAKALEDVADAAKATLAGTEFNVVVPVAVGIKDKPATNGVFGLADAVKSHRVDNRLERILKKSLEGQMKKIFESRMKKPTEAEETIERSAAAAGKQD